MTPKRRSNRTRFTWLFALVAVIALFAAACSSSDDTTATDDTSDTTTTEAASAAPSDADIAALTTSIAGGGASFPDSYYQAVNTDFNGIAGAERHWRWSEEVDEGSRDRPQKPRRVLPDAGLNFGFEEVVTGAHAR